VDNYGFTLVDLKFPKGSEAKVEAHTLKAFVEAFRLWRIKLNTVYVKKGLTPFKEYGNITESQWADFVVQKTMEAAQAESAKMIELVKRSIHPHHLGTEVTQKRSHTSGKVRKKPR
jgi:hypothetical protein